MQVTCIASLRCPLNAVLGPQRSLRSVVRPLTLGSQPMEARRLKLWYMVALLGLIALTVMRFKTFEEIKKLSKSQRAENLVWQDPHGASLSVCGLVFTPPGHASHAGRHPGCPGTLPGQRLRHVGSLEHSSEALRQCCKNCGIMAFIGGALDWRHGFFKETRCRTLAWPSKLWGKRDKSRLEVLLQPQSTHDSWQFTWTHPPAAWIFFIAHLVASEITFSHIFQGLCFGRDGIRLSSNSNSSSSP